MTRAMTICQTVVLLLPISMFGQSSHPSVPRNWATVTGSVVDQQGQPVAGAKVSAMPLDVAVEGPVPAPPITDSNGRFRLSTPAYSGRTRLAAIKESAGYPDTQGLLFSSPNDSMPEVSLLPGATIEGIVIRLGPPDGVIDASIVDAITAKPVSKARLNLRRDAPPAIYSATIPSDGHFRLALPPVPIHMSIDAPGYLHWEYRDEVTGKPELVLKNSTRKVLTITLVPHSNSVN